MGDWEEEVWERLEIKRLCLFDKLVWAVMGYGVHLEPHLRMEGESGYGQVGRKVF